MARVSVRNIQRIKLSFPLEIGVKKKVKTPRTTVGRRAVAPALLEDGYSQVEVAKGTNMSQGYVSNARKGLMTLAVMRIIVLLVGHEDVPSVMTACLYTNHLEIGLCLQRS